ncbi:hypothetical protein B0H14DRAFT_3641363 [Mycena olivaceomarginata]|nr:hypothetical protein B0H14DRAFT_3641363 [Mycena olivaceomarginata]
MQLLQNENALLQQRILVLEAEKATLQTNFNSLLSSISMSNPPPAAALPSSPRERPMSSSSAMPNVLPPPPFVVYNENEVLNATFWQQKLWNYKIEKDVGREATPGNPLATKNSLHFITDKDGAYPTRERITEARAICGVVIAEGPASYDLLSAPPVWFIEGGRGIKNY